MDIHEGYATCQAAMTAGEICKSFIARAEPAALRWHMVCHTLACSCTAPGSCAYIDHNETHRVFEDCAAAYNLTHLPPQGQRPQSPLMHKTKL